jgi:hypothetical protein
LYSQYEHDQHSYSNSRSPALCIIEEDFNNGILIILQLVAVCPHTYLENQGDTAVPDIIQRQIKVTVTTPPDSIVERPGQYEEDTAHPNLAANASEWLTVHELFSQEVGVAYV